MVKKTRRRISRKHKKSKRRHTRRRLKKSHQSGGGGMWKFLNVTDLFKKAEKKDDPNKKIDTINKGFLGMLENRITGLFKKQQAQLEETRKGILSQVKNAVDTASVQAKKAVGINKSSGGLTYEFLEKTLTKYFKGDSSKASEVIAFIKSNEVGEKSSEKEKEENKQLKNIIDDVKPNKDSDKEIYKKSK